jgi:hypothetical protein
MKPFAKATVIVLAVFAIVHALRLGLGWSASVDRLDIPLWVSIAALVVAGGLAFGLWREARGPSTASGLTASGLSVDQLTALLRLNQQIVMHQALLAPAFPPGLNDSQAQGRFEAFAKEMNCDTRLDPRMGTAEFTRKQ